MGRGVLIYTVTIPLTKIFSNEVKGGFVLWCREHLGKENQINVETHTYKEILDGKWCVYFSPENKEPHWGYFQLVTCNKQVATLAKLTWA
jgi:hypothetical protein